MRTLGFAGTDGASEFAQVANVLTDDEVTRANFAPNSGDQTAEYLFTNFVKMTTLWSQGFPAAAQGLLNRTGDILTVVAQRNTQVNHVTATLNGARNNLQQAIQTMQDRRTAIQQDPGLVAMLAPVIADLDAAVVSVQDVLANCTVIAYTQKIAQLAGPLATVTGEVVVNTGWPLVGRCQAEWTVVRQLVDTVSVEPLAETRTVLANNLARGRYYDFISWYGAAGYYAFVGRDSAAQAAILERVRVSGAVTATLHVAVPTMSCDASVLKPYLTAIAGAAVQANASTAVKANALCTAIQQVQHAQITLPAGVQANGWVAINDVRFPRGFSHQQISSDQACLKHSRLEVGAGADQQRLTAYFAELFVACQAARAGWQQAGRPNRLSVISQQATATWHIIVRDSNGHAEVFHVDSGYEKSPWRN